MSPLVGTTLLLAAFLIGEVLGQTSQVCPATVDASCYYQGAATRQPINTDVRQYFAIGGFFDVHERGSSLYECSSTIDPVGILNMQAFMWGIERYYSSYFSTRGISVGAIAFDICHRPSEAVENLLSYSKCKIHIQGVERGNVVAYIGPYDNMAVAEAARVASDLGITMISPTADSKEFNMEMHRSLLKLTPSFATDMMVVADVLTQLVMTPYVILLHDMSEPFWHQAYVTLRQHLTDRGVCIVYDVMYSGEPVTTELLDDLRNIREVKYVVPLMSREKLRTLLQAITDDRNIPGNSFRFIVTSEVGQDPQYMAFSSVTTNNTLIVESSSSDSAFPGVQDSYTDFANYINDLREGRTDMTYDNDWILPYRQSLPDLTHSNTPSSTQMSVHRTLQSVQLVMQAMQNVVADCGNTFCDAYRNQFSRENILYNQIKGSGIFADQSGDLAAANVNYRVYHYYIDNSRGDYMIQQVAEYSRSTFSTIRQLTDRAQYGTLFTDTLCTASNDQCCVVPTTTSTTRAPDSTVAASTTRDPNLDPPYAMVRYPYGQDITGAYMDADRGDGEYGTRFDDDHMWVIALGVLAGLGILCVVIFEIYILYKLLGTRLAHTWRTMWLGQLLLFGILLCYLTLIAFIFVPTKETCGITRFGVGVSYAFCFAVLLVKLMVILTSKTSDVLLPGEESPNYLKGIYQFLMFVFAVGVQVVIDVQWLITIPPEAVPVISNNGQRVWVCNHYTWEATGSTEEEMLDSMTRMSNFVRTNFENHVMSLVYIMFLILITTILSLNAHGIITNHRESVFIGISAGFSIPIWLAWTLVGGLNDDHDYAQEFGDACIAFGLFLTATLILFAMFLPKVRQLVNMGVEGIYLEDDRETYYGGSVIMAPPSYKSKGPNSVIYVNNNQGIYSEPVVIGNGDPMATHLRHPGSTYSAPSQFMKKPDSTYGGSRVLRVTDDLKGRHPQKRPQSEVNYGSRPRSAKGTLQRSRSQTNLGAL